MMKGYKIGHLWLLSNITWPVRTLSAREPVFMTLKKDQNDILHAPLGNIGESHSKRISYIVDDIDDDLSKICFCEIGIGANITRNLSKKLISAVTKKLKRGHIDLWGPVPDIPLHKN